MRIARAFALGLGAMRLVESVKELALDTGNLVLPTATKSTLSTALAAGGAFWLGRGESLSSRIETALSAAGIATLMHEAHAVLATTGDVNKARVMSTVVRRATTGATPATTQPGRRTPPVPTQ